MTNQIYHLLPPEGAKILLVLFLSFLMGLEREERKGGNAPFSFGGVRTFPLIGLIAYAIALLAGGQILPVVLGFAVVGGFLMLSYQNKVRTTASAGFTSEMSALATYVAAALEAREGADLLDPASWKKNPMPLFWESAKAGAFGTGHGAFFQSPDGKQDWMLYHANPQPHQGCGGRRSPRVQPFTWKPDGTPDFGRPVGIGVPLPAPSGEGQN
jgi:hypothetical protein